MNKTTIYELLGFTLGFLGLGIGYMAVYMGIRHDRYKRDLEHRERMTALELGRSLPGDLPWLSPVLIGFLIAAVVPVAVFVCAWLGTLQAGYHDNIWQAAGMVGMFAVVSGSVVSGLSQRQGVPKQDPTSATLNHKPQVEDDAYDVVSARG
jgi:hypothetical protein